MKRYEVFLKKDGRDEYRHAGSLNAPDPEKIGRASCRERV